MMLWEVILLFSSHYIVPHVFVELLPWEPLGQALGGRTVVSVGIVGVPWGLVGCCETQAQAEKGLPEDMTSQPGTE